MRVSPLQQNIEANFVQKNYSIICLMTLFFNKINSSFVLNVRKSVFLCALFSTFASGIGSITIAQNRIQNENAVSIDLFSSKNLKNENVINGTNNAQNPQIAETDGTRDASFNTGTGVNSNIQALAIQDDGKILLGGVFTSFNGTAANRIIRLNADGSVDNSFVYGSGFDEADVYVSAILVQSDGKILITGSFTRYNGRNANRIVRLNANGSVDTSFNYGTGFNQLTTILKQQEDGKIIVGGRFTTYKGVTANQIVRLNLDGNLDNTFSTGSGFNDNIFDILIQPDGKFIVGGSFQSYAGTTTANRIIRLQSNGSVDNTFIIGSGFDSSVATLALQEDGRIIVGGVFANYAGRTATRVVRLKDNGEFDFSFGSGINNNLSKAVIQDDGKIIFIGRFTSYNGTAANRIVRLNMNGSVDTSFEYGTGFNDTAELLEIQSDGKLVITGRFSTYNGSAANKLIRLIVEPPPTIAAPTPIYAAENVISVFSDTYTTVAETNLNPFWEQTTQVTFFEISGNTTMKYSKFNYQGIQLDETNHVDVSGMEYLHVDYWTENSTELKVYLISPGPVEVPYSLTVPTSGWNSIDIPLSEFDPVVLADVFQFKFEGNGTIYLDNLLFFKEDQSTSAPIITFQADMRSLLKDGIFNPNTETMNVVGNFDDNGATDWSTHFELTEGEIVDSIWTTSVTINNPNTIFNYKYKILSDNIARYNNSGWESPALWLGDNREQDIPETNLILEPLFPAIHLVNGEPNNRIDNALYIPLNETRNYDISGFDDPDFFSITVNEGDIVEIFTKPEDGTDLDLDLHVIIEGIRTRIAYSDYNDGMGSEKVVFTVPENADGNAVGGKTINFRVAHYVNQTYLSKINADTKPRVSAESGNYSVSAIALAPQFDGPSEISAQVESDTVVSISWSEVSGASNYRLSVSRTRNFFQYYGSGSLTDVEYSGTSAILNLPTDSVWYYYRVRAFNNAGETSRFSAVDSFYTLNRAKIDLESDLVAHYTFEGNTNDITGNDLNGSVNGLVDFPDGRHANTQTAHFDEQGEYIFIPDNPLFRLENKLTISAWVNNQNSAINYVFSKVYNSETGPYTSFGINAHGNATGNDPRFVFSLNTLNTGETFLNDTDQYNYNEWYHVVGTYDGAFMRLYVNGELKAEEPKVNNIDYNTESIIIGDNPLSTDVYQGNIDDVRLYSRALSSDEIKALYTIESQELIVVWPGDTNKDGIVSSADLIPIARYYGETFASNSEGIAWKQTLRNPWPSDEGNQYRIFADADGNGIIESADLLALYANYGKIVGAPDALKKQEQITNPIDLVFSAISLSENETQIEISVGYMNSIPIKGLAFKLGHSAFSNGFDGVSNINVIKGFSKSLSYFRVNSQESELDFAIGSTQLEQLPETGFIASFVIPFSKDKLKEGALTFKTKRLIDKNGTSIPINPVWNTLATSVENEIEIPKQNFVDQNYPNPFNPSTQIRFGINETAHVNLEVFDIQGRKVKTILSELKSAGTYNERINMEKGFASGLYFYRLRIDGANGFQQIFTRKMLLVK
jgi:uncharacterized delta-60 repeat protein